MKAIIFGVSGQDGHYLQKICELNKIEVIGVSRSPGLWLQGDVSNREFVSQLIKSSQPDFIFHLAAISTTRHSALFDNHEIISSGTLNVLEAAFEFCKTAKVFITGSGLQFLNEENPISERSDFHANNAYAVSRIHSAYAARYFRNLGLKTYVGYLFHHESPLRKDNHVSKMIANAVKRIANGSDEIIEIGDITVKKEWAFAGDIAQGIFDLTNQNQVFEATIGTGEPHSIEDWLEVCFSSKGLDWRKYVKLKEGFSPEYSFFVSDPTTIKSLGWKPKVNFRQLAEMMME